MLGDAILAFSELILHVVGGRLEVLLRLFQRVAPLRLVLRSLSSMPTMNKLAH